MNLKELQDICTETVVSIFSISMATPKDAIIGELKMILTKAQALAHDEDITKSDFSMDPDIPYEEMLPAINLGVQNAKLRGQDLSLFNKLSNRTWYACKSWHIEVASKFAHRMKDLVQYTKDLGLVEKYWGKHVHLAKVTDLLSNLRGKNQVNLAQYHTIYQMLMMAEELLGVILLNKTLDIIHLVSKAIISTLSLHDVLLNYPKMSDGHSMIAEVHQEGILKPTAIIIPIRTEAERMALMMNRNLPSFLWNMLRKHGMPKDFIIDLLGKLFEASLVANVYKCLWDKKKRMITTKEEEEKEEEVKAFESAAWFKDEFGILGKKDQGKKHAPPEALFNLDGNESYKTIHNCHKRLKEPVGTPPSTN